MNKNCIKCNNVFYKKQTCSKKEWAISKYCSHSCANSMSADRTRLADYIKQNGAWNKGKKMPRRENSASWKGGEIILICKECECYFQVKNYRKHTAQFCSPLCRTNNRNQGKTPANEKIRKSAAYKAWRTLVFERDNYTCVECKAHSVYLHADHIKPFALFPELRLEISNGRTLCVPCHKATSTYGRGKIFRMASAQEA